MTIYYPVMQVLMYESLSFSRRSKLVLSFTVETVKLRTRLDENESEWYTKLGW